MSQSTTPRKRKLRDRGNPEAKRQRLNTPKQKESLDVEMKEASLSTTNETVIKTDEPSKKQENKKNPRRTCTMNQDNNMEVDKKENENGHKHKHKHKKIKPVSQTELSYLKEVMAKLSNKLEESNMDLLKRPVLQERDVGVLLYAHRLNNKNDKIDSSQMEDLDFMTFVNEDDNTNTDTSQEIFGIIKQRCHDFIVREVSEERKIAPLLPSKEIPPSPLQTIVTEETIQNTLGKEKCDILFQSIAELKDCIEFDLSDNNNIADKEESKKKRKLIHTYINNNYPDLVHYSKGDDIIVLRKKSDKLNAKRNDGNDKRTPPFYLKFVLVKKHNDVQACLEMTGSKLKMGKNCWKRFNFAGNKDKRGLTSQWITAFKLDAEKLASTNVQFKHGLCNVGDFEYVGNNGRLRLGQLYGNYFQIAIKNIQIGSDNANNNKKNTINEIKKILQQRCQLLNQIGFINYFGMQRFGTSVVSTHEIGKYMLLKDWEMIGALLLCPRSHENPSIAKSRETFIEGGDRRKLSRVLFNERMFLSGLIRDLKSKDQKFSYANAFQGIPYNNRLMFVHSYQSYIWNLCITFRLNKFGFKVQIGDLVKCSSSDNEIELPDVNDDAVVGDAENENSAVTKESINDNVALAETNIKKVMHVTAENQHSFTIHDVVFPLVNDKAVWPKNEVKEYLDKLLAEDGLTIGHFQQSQFGGANGIYRHILLKPEDLDLKVVKYTRPNECLIDEIKNTELIDEEDEKDVEPKNDTTHQVEKIKTVNPKGHVGAVASFTLRKSAYATMAIRELLGISSVSMKVAHS